MAFSLFCLPFRSPSDLTLFHATAAIHLLSKSVSQLLRFLSGSCQKVARLHGLYLTTESRPEVVDRLDCWVNPSSSP